MKLLFDQNLPARLVSSLSAQFPESVHVRPLGLAVATDLEIWQYARDRGFSIMSKDGDFSQLSLLHGAPPKVIWLRAGNASTSAIETFIRTWARRIVQFEAAMEEALLVIEP